MVESACCRLRKRGGDAGLLRRGIGVGGVGESAGCAAPVLVAEGEGMSVSSRSAAAEERSVNSSTMGESQLRVVAIRTSGAGRGALCGRLTGLAERPETRLGAAAKGGGVGAAAGPGRGSGGPRGEGRRRR